MLDLKSIFTKASKSFFSANAAIMEPSSTKNALQGNVERSKAKRWPLEEFDYETDNPSEIPNTLPQPNEAPALDSADAGETKGLDRPILRFIGFRVRPLDPDNFAGSCKDLLDGCVHAGLIHGDEWWRIDFQTRQEKVRTYAEERTIIQIET